MDVRKCFPNAPAGRDIKRSRTRREAPLPRRGSSRRGEAVVRRVLTRADDEISVSLANYSPTLKTQRTWSGSESKARSSSGPRRDLVDDQIHREREQREGRLKDRKSVV